MIKRSSGSRGRSTCSMFSYSCFPLYARSKNSFLQCPIHVPYASWQISPFLYEVLVFIVIVLNPAFLYDHPATCSCTVRLASTQAFCNSF